MISIPVTIGYGYEKWLTESEIEMLKLYFQRRHLFEHNNGMIDEQYLSKTNDTGYAAGQRLVIRKDEIEAVLRILKKLGTGMLSIT